MKYLSKHGNKSLIFVASTRLIFYTREIFRFSELRYRDFPCLCIIFIRQVGFLIHHASCFHLHENIFKRRRCYQKYIVCDLLR